MPRDVVVSLDGYVLRMRRRDSARIVERARARRGTHNERRPYRGRARVRPLPAGVPARARARVPRRSRPARRRGAAARAHRRPVGGLGRRSHRRRRPRAGRGRPARVGGRPVEPGASPARRARRARSHVAGPQRHRAGARSARVPPRSSAPRRRACSPTRSRRCCSGSAVPTSPRSQWTDADLALVDEADSLLGPPSAARPRSRRRRTPRLGARAGPPHDRRARRGRRTPNAADVLARYGSDSSPSSADDDEPRTFGHVLVDEAQDLTRDAVAHARPPLPHGLDDPGRRLRPGEPSGRAVELGRRHRQSARAGAARTGSTLTVNYRTPAEIMDVANRLLPAAAPGVEPARPVRSTGAHPEVLAVGTVRARRRGGAPRRASRRRVAAPSR